MAGLDSPQLETLVRADSQTNSAELKAVEIRQRMSVIRRYIRDDVDGIVQNAQQLADWKHYVRAFPLGSLVVAAVAGYVAVPRRLEVAGQSHEI